MNYRSCGDLMASLTRTLQIVRQQLGADNLQAFDAQWNLLWIGKGWQESMRRQAHGLFWNLPEFDASAFFRVPPRSRIGSPEG